jgi:hypothetical protein
VQLVSADASAVEALAPYAGAAHSSFLFYCGGDLVASERQLVAPNVVGLLRELAPRREAAAAIEG